MILRTCLRSAHCPGKHPACVLGTLFSVPRGHWGQRANSEGDSFWLCRQPDESPSLSLSSGKGQDCGAELRPGLGGQADCVWFLTGPAFWLKALRSLGGVLGLPPH